MKYTRQRGDWMRLRCGDRVADVTDIRHVGCVDAILQGSDVKVTWDNGWVSYVRLDRLQRERTPADGSGSIPLRPR
jgi:hypothetical protein